MTLLRNRGVLYAALLGILVPMLYVELLVYATAYIEIPLSGYIIENYSIGPKVTTYTVGTIVDAIVAMVVAIMTILPLGLFGHGSILTKMTFFVSGFVVAFLSPWDFSVELEVIIRALTDFSILFFLCLCIGVLYYSDIKGNNA